MNERSSLTQALAVGVLGSRIAYGVGLLAAPERLAGNKWLGQGAGEPAAVVPLRGVGAREVALHGLALGAFLGGRPLRPWLYASIAGDLADIGATTMAREGLPRGSAAATAAVAGGSLALSVLVAVLVDR
jgi:hypothetical protein